MAFADRKRCTLLLPLPTRTSQWGKAPLLRLQPISRQGVHILHLTWLGPLCVEPGQEGLNGGSDVRLVLISLVHGLPRGRGLCSGGCDSSHFLLKPQPMAQEEPRSKGRRVGSMLCVPQTHLCQRSLRICPFPLAGNNENIS